MTADEKHTSPDSAQSLTASGATSGRSVTTPEGRVVKLVPVASLAEHVRLSAARGSRF